MRRRIEAIAGAEIRETKPLAGGMISQALKIVLDDGMALAAKLSDGDIDLRVEGFMLRYLRQKSDLPVPHVWHADSDLLLMQFIDGETVMDNGSLRHLAGLLAACHQISAPQYGLERDTLTGPYRQPNRQSDSWIAFFRERRLLYMLDVARASGQLPAELETRLLRCADSLDRWLIEPERPSLIHGDIWRANILTRAGEVVGLIDPALYYAHREIELAYMALFDGFGDIFFDAYHAIAPIDPDFFVLRRHVYNLYPLLTHLAIFGAKYLPHLDETLNRLGY